MGIRAARGSPGASGRRYDRRAGRGQASVGPSARRKAHLLPVFFSPSRSSRTTALGPRGRPCLNRAEAEPDRSFREQDPATCKRHAERLLDSDEPLPLPEGMEMTPSPRSEVVMAPCPVATALRLRAAEPGQSITVSLTRTRNRTEGPVACCAASTAHRSTSRNNQGNTFSGIIFPASYKTPRPWGAEKRSNHRFLSR